jgi:hypothetical protein
MGQSIYGILLFIVRGYIHKEVRVAPTVGLPWEVECWSARQPSPVGHSALLFGMRTLTGLQILPLVKGAQTVSSGLRSAVQSRLFLEK